MTYFGLSGLLLGFSSFIMAIIMLIGGRKLINMLWSGLCISMSLLGLCMWHIGDATLAEGALWWWRVGYIGVICTPVLVFHTVYYLIPDRPYYERYIIILLYIFTLIFEFLNISGNLLQETTLMFGRIFFDAPMSFSAKIFFLYFNTVFAYVFFILGSGYMRYRQSDYEVSRQILYLGIGIGLGAVGGYSLYLPLLGIMVYPYVSILMMFYPLIVGYAILHHHLFDARYAVLQLLRIITIGILVLTIGGILWILSMRYLHYTPAIHLIEISIWATMFAGATIFYHSQKIAGFFSISSLVDLEHAAEKLLEHKGVYRNMKDLLFDIEEFFASGMKIKKSFIMNHSAVMHHPNCVLYFQKFRHPLVLSELESDSIEGESPLLIEEVRKIGEVIFPLEKGIDGDFLFLVLGPKESEKNITEEELKIIDRILPKITLAIQILEFNQSLQNEVQIQTKTLAKKNRELEVAYQKLQTIDQDKDNFLAIASHELRTPMTIIKGYADLFLKNALGPLTLDEQRYMKKIYDSTESLIELVNNILDLSKIEAGRMEKIITKVDIHALVHKSLSDFEGIYKEKKISLLLTDNAPTSIISTDESKIHMILTNLLSNAYKFTPSGGRVDVKLVETPRFLHISVHDTGVGISDKQLPHIFEKFNQSSNTNYTKKSIRGTGLGLNLSKQVIEMLGGTIGVSSTEGSGSVFEFTLPI